MANRGIELTRTNSICPSPEELLLDSVEKNDIQKIRELVKEKPKILEHIYDYPHYTTILQICCRNFKDKVRSATVETLIHLGADVLFTQELDEYKQTLHFAAESTKPEILYTIVRELKKHPDGSINALDANGNTALHLLIKNGDSSSSGFQRCAEILVENGIDINKGDSRNQSAVLLAARSKYKSVVQYLCAQPNIDIDSHKDRKKKSARDYINENGLIDSIPEQNGVENNNVNFVERLFSYLKSEDIDGFLNSGDLTKYANESDGISTLLQFACKQGHTEAVAYLLHNQADPNLTTPKTTKLPVEIASEKGFHEIFEILIERNDVTIPHSVLCNLLKQIDRKKIGQHIDYEKCYNLLKSKLKEINLNGADDIGNTPLHFAIAYANPEDVLELLDMGASLASKNDFGISPVQDMRADLLERHLDNCIQTNANDIREDCVVSFNYRTLLPPQKLQIKKDFDTEKNPLQEIKELVAETEVIAHISHSKELKHLLKHPVISSFLFMKWHRLRWFLYTNIGFYITFALSLILYILLFYSQHTEEKTEMKNSGYSVFLLLVLSVSLVVLFCRELFQVLISPKTYFLSLENWIELCLIAVTFSVLLAGSHSVDTRKQLSAVAVLLATFELVLLLGQHPKICTNVVMLRTVAYNFFKFLLWFSILILAFAFSFYVLFNKNSEKSAAGNGTNTEEEQDFFSDPGMSIVKTIVMLTGEFDASSINFQTFPITSRLIFLMFVFLIAIIVFNLLNGLAVSDTHMIQSDAELVGLIARVEHIRYVECMVLGNLVPTRVLSFIKTYCCCIPISDRAYVGVPKYLAERICLFPHYLHNYSLSFYPMKKGQVILESSHCNNITGCYNCSGIYLDSKSVKNTLHKLQERKIEQKTSFDAKLLMEISRKLDLILNANNIKL